MFLLSFNSLFSQQLRSDGKIKNNGTIIIKGNAIFSQDSINGTIEFDKDDKSFNQYIPQIHYEKLVLKGSTPKVLSDSTSHIWISKELRTDERSIIKHFPTTNLHSRGKTVHNGAINPAYKYGTVLLDGSELQEVSGKGLFRNILLDNLSNCVLVDSGGFEISSDLILLNGLLFNSSEHNFILHENSKIIRYDNGKLNTYPDVFGPYSVEYRGDGKIICGYEIPENDTLVSLLVNNDGGIVLSNDIKVRDTLLLNSDIYTKNEKDEYYISYYGNDDPIFINDNSEIIGAFRRYGLKNEMMKFNNSYTAIETSEYFDSVEYIELKVCPETEPEQYHPNVVKRSIELSAKDLQGNDIDTLPEFQFTIGWRHPEETNNLGLNELVMQRYADHYWKNYEKNSNAVSENNWTYLKTNSVRNTGIFAVGLPSPQSYSISMKLYLEGAFMSEDMITQELPDFSEISSEYPYNNLTNAPEISSGNFTDHLVLHFVSSDDTTDIYLLALLDKNGNIRNADGSFPFRIHIEDAKADNYFISILHHNHLDIITENSFKFAQFNDHHFDFTEPHLVLGRENSLKPVKISDGKITWAMIAGDVDDNNIVDDNDLVVIKNNIGLRSYINNVNYHGLINTSDLNYVWNNLGRVSAIVK
jgi:hypothetical protein